MSGNGYGGPAGDLGSPPSGGSAVRRAEASASDIPSIAYRNGVGSRHVGRARRPDMPAEWQRGWDHADADLTGCAIAAEPVNLVAKGPIHITVTAPQGAGKTTIANKIDDILTDAGFKVERRSEGDVKRTVVRWSPLSIAVIDEVQETHPVFSGRAPESPKQRFVIGDRVAHPVYGRGTVVVLLPYLAVDFDQVARRTQDGDTHRVTFTGDSADVVRPSTAVKPTSHKLTGVGGVFCASHSPNGAPIHGHTWEVTAWFPAGDADDLRDRLHALLKRWDHTHLPDHIAWGEDLAEHIGFLLPGAVRVQVSRPLERIYAEWKLV